MSSDRKNILLALHQIYFDKMMDGTKLYEYRATFPKEPVRAFIYAPREVKAIIGVVELAAPIVGAPEEIAELHAKCGDGDYDAMLEWMGDKETYCAMRVESATRFDKPIPYDGLKEKFPDFFAPQSYLLLDTRPELLHYIEDNSHY